jgi:NADPH-dependent 2,4-dienoyl-CoA reductase/sulfur reductase-like enzyme
MQYRAGKGRIKMNDAKVVIIGGSVAGIEAAIVVQRHHKVEKITVIRKEEKVPVPCGIPYIYGTLGTPDKNLIPDTMLGGVELVIDEVTSLDRNLHTVTTEGGKNIAYDKLILATGSFPLVPQIPGVDLEGVFPIKKDIKWLQRLDEALSKARNVVVIGGGFIGVEFADECRKKGINVTIVEMLPNCLFLACDEEFCIRAEEILKGKGIAVITNKTAQSIDGSGRVEYVGLSDGKQLKADVVILGIGVVPNTDLAQKAGLEIGKLRGIKVDAYMRTDDPDILAAGDCAEKFSFFSGKPSGLRLASIATREARLAAINLFEPRRRNEGTIGVFATAIGEIGIGVAGLTEKAARAEGFDCIIGEASAVDKHPGGMPGARELRVKLIFDGKSGRLIGGEACGGVTAGEMTNIMATAIANRMTADQLTNMQIGTHPALTASPIAYQLVNAAEQAFLKMQL